MWDRMKSKIILALGLLFVIEFPLWYLMDRYKTLTLEDVALMLKIIIGLAAIIFGILLEERSHLRKEAEKYQEAGKWLEYLRTTLLRDFAVNQLRERPNKRKK